MGINDSTTFEVSTDGDIDKAAIERARERIERIGDHCREHVSHVEFRIKDSPSHPSQNHVRAEATLVVKHGPVRAHAEAQTLNEAIDMMLDRLRRRVDRHESKLHRIGAKRHDGVAAEGSWRHGDVATAPRRPAPVTNEPGAVIRRKSFAYAPMSVEEAIFDLQILDHSFYLFVEMTTGEACTVSHDVTANVEAYQLAIPPTVEVDLPADFAITRVDGPLLFSEAEAKRLLTTTGEPFVFFRKGPTDRGQVLYRRYDGDFGVVELNTPENATRSG